MRRNSKLMQIVWALFLGAVVAEMVNVEIVRNISYASETRKIAETISIVIGTPSLDIASVDVDTEVEKPEIEYSGEYSAKGFTEKEQELWSHEYALDELESEQSKIVDERIRFFDEYHVVSDETYRLLKLRTQMRKQGTPVAEQAEIESQIRELKVQTDRLDQKIKESDLPLKKLRQEIAKVEQWILDVKVTVDDSENYINELYDRRILIRPKDKAKYEQERNKWLRLKKKPGGKEKRQKDKGSASVS